MKKGFKKFLASAVTAIATVCLSLGMVSSVYAVDGASFTILPEDFYEGQTAGFSVGKVAPTSTSLTVNGATVALQSGTNYYGAIATDSYATSKSKTITNDTGVEFTNELCVGGARTITITPYSDGNITLYWYDGGSKSVTVGSLDAVDATNWTVTTATDACTAGTDFTITLGGSNICLLAIEFVSNSSTVFDNSLFGDETTDNTAYLPGETATVSVASTDVIAAAVGYDSFDAAVEAAAFADKDTLGSDIEINGLTFGSGLLMYTDGSLRSGGKTSSSNPRWIMVDANVGDTIVLEGCRSQNATDETRYLSLATSIGDIATVSAYAPIEAADVSLTVSEAGTYYVNFSNGIMFEGVSVYSGVAVTAPMITIEQSGEYILATISSDADANLVVNAINFAAAKGYELTGTKIDAQSISVTKVFNDQFLVKVNAGDDAEVKAQASLTYSNNGSDVTVYSNILEY